MAAKGVPTPPAPPVRRNWRHWIRFAGVPGRSCAPALRTTAPASRLFPALRAALRAPGTRKFMDREVDAQPDQVAPGEQLVPATADGCAGTSGEAAGPGEVFQAGTVCQQAHCGARADGADPGDVVRGVASQGPVVALAGSTPCRARTSPGWMCR